MMRFLINGWATTATVWQDLVSKQDFCYDISERADYDDLCDVFHENWLNNHQQPLVLIGWSLGSLLALQLAKKYPQQVRQLLIFSGMACFAGDIPYGCQPPTIVKNLRRQLRRNLQKTQQDFYSLMFSAAETAQKTAFLAQATPPKNTAALDYGLAYLLQTDLHQELPEITTKTHLIHGAADSICPLPTAQQLAASLPNARLTILPDCGHIPFFTQKEFCLKAMEKYI